MIKKILWIPLVILYFNNALADPSIVNKQYSIYDESEESYKQVIIDDPFESFNRGMHKFNKEFDRYLLEPITSAYEQALPKQGRIVVDNVLSNLREPLSAVNHALQLDLYNSLASFWRFFFNLTFGVLGTQDFAGKYLNLQLNYNDFDTTLAKYCVKHGPYFVLPILGPNTLRGGVGKAVDIFGDPLNFAFSGEDWNRSWLSTKSGLSIINFRSTHKRLFDDLNDLSADDYAMIKSVYSQKIYHRDLRFKYCNNYKGN